MAQVLDIVKLMEKLAAIEEEGVAFYESLARHTKNEKIRKLARTMGRVEKRHQLRFEKLAESASKGKKPKPLDDVTAGVRQYIHALIDYRIFHTPEHAAKIAANLDDENEAVDMAVQFEKENILLLLECGSIVRGEARKFIKTFIEQERAHIRSLQRLRRQLAKIK